MCIRDSNHTLNVFYNVVNMHLVAQQNDEFDEERLNDEELALLLTAVIFHDIVYDYSKKEKSNEELSAETVSYTHLDVYKRQPKCHGAGAADRSSSVLRTDSGKYPAPLLRFLAAMHTVPYRFPGGIKFQNTQELE